jgi:hypothetical protein
MMTPTQLETRLSQLLSRWEGECVEFKEANDNFPTSDIGKYFSALSNEANLRSLSSAWLVFGVNDKTRTVSGTNYRIERDRLQSLKQQIAAATETEPEYLHHKAFDDQYYCDLIVQYLKQFRSARRSKFNRLLEGKLSDLLTPVQKRTKIKNLLQRLQREGKIEVDGKTNSAVWRIKDS